MSIASLRTPVRLRLALALAVGTALWSPPAASAAERSLNDARRDAPRGVDITAWKVRYGEDEIVAVMRVRGLVRRERQRFALVLPSMSGPEGQVQHAVLNVGRDLRRSVDYWYVREVEAREPCDGLRASISYRRDRVVIVLPRHCLDLSLGDSWDRRDFRVVARTYSRSQYAEGYPYGTPAVHDFTRKTRLSAG